jgi:hypothetical protein
MDLSDLLPLIQKSGITLSVELVVIAVLLALVWRLVAKMDVLTDKIGQSLSDQRDYHNKTLSDQHIREIERDKVLGEFIHKTTDTVSHVLERVLPESVRTCPFESLEDRIGKIKNK